MDAEHRDSKGRFVAGNPGGPGGTRSQFRITPFILAELEREHEKTGKPKGQILAEQVVAEALNMREWAVKLVYERAEGKPHEQIMHEIEMREPLRLLNLGEEPGDDAT